MNSMRKKFLNREIMAPNTQNDFYLLHHPIVSWGKTRDIEKMLKSRQQADLSWLVFISLCAVDLSPFTSTLLDFRHTIDFNTFERRSGCRNYCTFIFWYIPSKSCYTASLLPIHFYVTIDCVFKQNFKRYNLKSRS